MKIKLYRFDLPLEFEFSISRESRTTQQSLVVQLEHHGVLGFGEVTENAFYGHSVESMIATIERCRSEVEAYEFGTPAQLWQQIEARCGKDRFALAAIDLAACDLFGKLTKKRTYETLGLKWENVPESSYTIGIDTVEKMTAKLRSRPDWKIYKIKLGHPGDVEIVRRLRQQTTATFRVDANGGWTAAQTIENAPLLKELGVELIEQPLHPSAPEEEQLRVFHESALPIIADESCQVESDVAACFGRFHGVNIKLCKCGGLTPGLRMLREARHRGMKTMVGCMVESSIGISAAAQLLPLVDYADLDGAALLAKDPARGVTVTHGVVELGERLGNGCELA
ncbi:dipeptide epimerase [Novipirellula artificiosorum]|uniref:Dipeptide epimerase n=1 Tax=Novipirellula artificiosorum TaxID=2528016 RepID=A0A5C6DGQ5_9BACT|nr:dipeptide epimerase [Novipirellula artificiosorum]TWU35007.1 L-Ala-D/L-Glu epimerase [Novipirellula artificiosorum]